MKYIINNELNHLTAMHEFHFIKAQITSIDKEIEIDLSKITIIDAAGLAVLLKLKSTIIKSNKTIRYSHIPENILSMCKLYYVQL